MDVIQQTNRTILFEEINPEKLDLLTLVGDTKGLNIYVLIKFLHFNT